MHTNYACYFRLLLLLYLVSIVNKYISNIMSSIYVNYHIQIIVLLWLLFVQLPQMNLRYQFSQIFVGLVIDKSEILQDLAPFFSWIPDFLNFGGETETPSWCCSQKLITKLLRDTHFLRTTQQPLINSLIMMVFGSCKNK